MMAESTKTDLANSVPDEIRQKFEAMIISGELKHTDHRILRALFENPGATSRELAPLLGMTKTNVTRRMNSAAFLKARQLFEGTVSDKMRQAADTFSRIVVRWMNDEEHGAGTLKPGELLEAGKLAFGHLTKEAELALKSKEVDIQARQVPLAPAEAKTILDADVVNKPDIKVEIPDL